MKKHFIYLLAASLSLGMTASGLSSCGDDDPTEDVVPPGNNDEKNDDDDSNDGPNTPVAPDDKLNSTEQKQKLESVANDFMAEVQANNFTSLKNLTEYCTNHYLDNDDFDNDVVNDWFEAALDASSDQVSSKKEDHGGWIESRKLYNRVIALSNFTGHFTAQKDSWKKEKANNLKFTFTDQDRQLCNITVTSSGKTKKAYVGTTEDWDSFWDQENNKWYDYIDEYDEYIMVPEHITVTLTQGNTTLVETVVNIDHSAFTGPEINLMEDGLVTDVVSKVADFTWEVQRAEYSANNNKASITGSMKKGNKTLATFNAQTDDLTTSNDTIYNAGRATFTLDLMGGQMQIVAKCQNAKAYADLLERADDNDDNETLFKSYINQANELTDIAVFYDNGKTRQASMKLMPFKEESYWSSDSWWYSEPVIVFDDGSTYSTFNAYFNEKDFRSVIDTFESLMRGYEDLLDE